MLFSSHPFIFAFLPLTLLAIYLAKRFVHEAAGPVAMIGASLVFYYFNGLAQLPVLVGSVILNHLLITLWINLDNRRARSALLFTAIGFNLLALIYFKYATFLIQQYESLSLVVDGKYPLFWAIDIVKNY